MYGHWTFSDVYQNNSFDLEEVRIGISSIDGAATTFRGFAGIGWSFDFCDEQYCFALRLGYEAQFWLSQLQFYSLSTGRFNNVLTLQGGTVDIQFHF